MTCDECKKRVSEVAVVLVNAEPRYRELCEPCFVSAEQKYCERESRPGVWLKPRPFSPSIISRDSRLYLEAIS